LKMVQGSRLWKPWDQNMVYLEKTQIGQKIKHWPLKTEACNMTCEPSWSQRRISQSHNCTHSNIYYIQNINKIWIYKFLLIVIYTWTSTAPLSVIK
jgi:hypothetical protein